jgi:transcription elongation factor Elf1
MSSNPLQKYFRQPKVFVSLPSKGMFYPEGDFQGDANNVPVFAMTGMDEIIMKTPDALFSGEATVKLIESCCPFIKNARHLPSLDLDVLLVAIRIATFGNSMNVTANCGNCGEENDFEIPLNSILEHYNSVTFNTRLNFNSEITINFKPLTYEEMTNFNIENFKLQKMLGQLVDVSVEERQQHLDSIYARLADIQAEIFTASVESVQTPETIVTDKEFILDFLKNIPREAYIAIKDALDKNKEEWNMPKQPIKCESCGHEDKLTVTLDQSNFFE